MPSGKKAGRKSKGRKLPTPPTSPASTSPTAPSTRSPAAAATIANEDDYSSGKIQRFKPHALRRPLQPSTRCLYATSSLPPHPFLYLDDEATINLRSKAGSFRVRGTAGPALDGLTTPPSAPRPASYVAMFSFTPKVRENDEMIWNVAWLSEKMMLLDVPPTSCGPWCGHLVYTIERASVVFAPKTKRRVKETTQLLHSETSGCCSFGSLIRFFSSPPAITRHHLMHVTASICSLSAAYVYGMLPFLCAAIYVLFLSS